MEFIGFYGILLELKYLSFKFLNIPARSAGVRPDGRPDQRLVDWTGRLMLTKRTQGPAK